MEQAHMQATITSRGFVHMPPISCAYGGDVRVYESSAASAPHIWVLARQLSDMNDDRSELIESAVHLTLESAQQLRDQLNYLIDNHYQNED